jgi:hypothetical protein
MKVPCTAGLAAGEAGTVAETPGDADGGAAVETGSDAGGAGEEEGVRANEDRLHPLGKIIIKIKTRRADNTIVFIFNLSFTRSLFTRLA